MQQMKLDLSDMARESRAQAGAISKDKEGREILIGLTHEESVWYLAFQARSIDPDKRKLISYEDKLRWLGLAERHNQQRLINAGLEPGAVQQAEKDPTRH